MNYPTVWEYIRVKFLPGTDPKGKRTKMSRPKRIYKITYFDEDGVITDTQFAPAGVKGTSRRIEATTFITEWEHGPTPTPKPLNKYSDTQLKQLGYSPDEIFHIRERRFSSKDIKLVSHNLKISREEAKVLLTEHKGNRHAIYKKKNTKGIKIDGDWKTNIPGAKKTEEEKQLLKKKGPGGRFINKTKRSLKFHAKIKNRTALKKR
jgi:hypothetical protein